jgi:hypothetical protein
MSSGKSASLLRSSYSTEPKLVLIVVIIFPQSIQGKFSANNDAILYMTLQSWLFCVYQFDGMTYIRVNCVNLFNLWTSMARRHVQKWILTEIIYTRAPEKFVYFTRLHGVISQKTVS